MQALGAGMRRGGRALRTGFDRALLESPDYQRLLRVDRERIELGRPPYRLRRGADEAELGAHTELLDRVLESGSKGLGIQRYKGLGEMNPEQLEETTMNANNRVLLQVRIEDAVEADDVFTMLMGEIVEPRRHFIEENALNAENVDV